MRRGPLAGRVALLIGTRTPTPVRTGFQLRDWQHLVALHRLGADVHLLPLDVADGFEADARELPATVHALADEAPSVVQGWADVDRFRWIADGTHPFAGIVTEPVVAQVRELVRALDPALVVVSDHEASALLSSLPATEAAVLLDLHNVFANLMLDLSGLHGGRAADLLGRRAAAAADRLDAELMERADLVTCCSELDRRGLEQIAATTRRRPPVLAIANTVDALSYPAPAPTSPPRAVLTGSFAYAPNVLAAERLARLLDDLPDLRVDLVGAGGSPQAQALAAHPRLTVTGRVPDVRPYLAAATVAAMPIDGGSGTRLKVAEAMAAGVPIVATAKAVEGVGLVPGTHYLQIQTDDELREAVRAVIDDPTLAQRLATAGHAFALEHLSWEAATRSTAIALADLGFDLDP